MIGAEGLTEREMILRVVTEPEALWVRNSLIIKVPREPEPTMAKVEDIFTRDEENGKK